MTISSSQTVDHENLDLKFKKIKNLRNDSIFGIKK
jgi:hypothetical protein